MKINQYLIKTFSQRDEIENIEKYLDKCKSKGNLNFSNIVKFPKVSIITAIYNRGEYLLRFLNSIQLQKFNDIEIILIDDFSSDNTLNLIKHYQKIDKRIVLIKNKKNYGTFKSRNLGIMKSTGKYLILPDPDDILSKNCLHILFNFATKYNYDMLRFNLYEGNNKIFTSKIVDNIPSRPVFQPELKTFIFYASGKLSQIDFSITNKFIKREALIQTLNLLSKNYLNIYMIILEDGALNFILHRTAKSLYFIKKIGYYYIKNKSSITKNNFDFHFVKYIFIYLKIVFEFSKNNKLEKNMFNLLFELYIVRKFNLTRMIINKDYLEFFKNAVELFLENEFISNKNRRYLIAFKKHLKNFHYLRYII